MKEDLLQYIWEQKILTKQPLKTTQGKLLEIIKPGRINHNAGPDFFDARIKINNTLWAGNVEVHVNSSDWVKHKHQKNPAYDNVILHVVFRDDAKINIPTLELRHYLSDEFINTYKKLQASSTRIPCQKQLQLPPDVVIQSFLFRLMIERLEKKCVVMEEQLLLLNNDWETLFYVNLAKYFGMGVNAAPFEQLALKLPNRLLAKHKHSQQQITALVFGVAGLLPVHANDEYSMLLCKEFAFLQKKYGLTPLATHTWKFAKMRPANFPTVRLAQFSSLVFNAVHLFSKIIQAKTITEVIALFQNKTLTPIPLKNPSDTSNAKAHQLGKQTINHLLINVVIPIKFIYGKYILNETLCEQALDWLEKTPVENNTISRLWLSLGFKAKHALHSQALIELTNGYCVNKRCLKCAIGLHILHNYA
jgi:hypothetical protein